MSLDQSGNVGAIFWDKFGMFKNVLGQRDHRVSYGKVVRKYISFLCHLFYGVHKKNCVNLTSVYSSLIQSESFL